MIAPTNPDEHDLRRTASGTSHVSREDERLFGELLDRFAVLAQSCFRFSQEIKRRTITSPGEDVEETVRKSVSLARRLFGERLLEILAVLALMQPVRFDDLEQILGGFSKDALREKLQVLVSSGLVQSDAAYGGTDATCYTLTHKGTIIAQLGEPVFLYLRLAEGWTAPLPEDERAQEAEKEDEVDPDRASAGAE